MVVRRRINRWTVFLLNLILSIHSGAQGNDDFVKSLPRELQDVVFACAGVDEITQEGNIYLEVRGRPAYLQEGHFHVLEDALVSLYESAAKQTCSTGYRHLTGVRVNRASIPDTTDVVTFVIDFEVTGRCKGCSDNIDFLSHFGRRRRIRASPQQSHRLLGSKKGSKKSSSSEKYYIQYTQYEKPHSSHRYYYGNTGVDHKPPTSSSSCHCPPPVVEGLEYAFGIIIRDILDLRSIYDGTPRLGDDIPTPPIFSGPPSPMMPIPAPPSPMMPNTTPPPTMMMPNPSPTPPPTMGQGEPTPLPVSPPPTRPPTPLPTPPPTPPPTMMTPPPSSNPSSRPSTSNPQPSSTPSASPSIAPTPQQQVPSATPSVAGNDQVPSSTPSARPSVKNEEPQPSEAPSPGQNNNVCDAQNNPINYRSPNCDVGTKDGYQICLEFLNLPCEDASLFDEAVAFWESIVTSDLADHTIPLNFLDDPSFCGPGYTVPDPMDDLFICGMYTNIDGANNVLGTGTSVNDGSGVPKPILWGILKLDSTDLNRLQGDRNLYYDVVLHEIGHVLGIGNNWRLSTAPLVNSNCEYTGAEAVAVYRALSGCTTGFPLAECGNGHWSEACFDAELMTPSRNAGGVLISEMSVATLDDMGYTTNRNAVVYDFISFDIAASCRCNANLQAVQSGLVWQWNKPIKHKDPPVTQELREEASKAVPPLVKVFQSDSGENITIGTTSTVLFWNEEGENFYEVSVY